MRKIFRTKRRKILTALLGILGISSLMGCGMYGSPYAKIKIRANVVDESNNPIPGIKLELKDLNQNHRLWEITTDNNGEFKKDYTGLDWRLEEGANVVFYEKNNKSVADKYVDDSLRVINKKTKSGGKMKNSWYEGTYRMEFTMKLRRK